MNEQTTHHHEHSHHHHYTHPWAFLSDMEKLGDEYLVRRAPWQIPHSWKTAIAKILPILAILIAVLTLP